MKYFCLFCCCLLGVLAPSSTLEQNGQNFLQFHRVRRQAGTQHQSGGSTHTYGGGSVSTGSRTSHGTAYRTVQTSGGSGHFVSPDGQPYYVYQPHVSTSRGSGSTGQTGSSISSSSSTSQRVVSSPRRRGNPLSSSSSVVSSTGRNGSSSTRYWSHSGRLPTVSVINGSIAQSRRTYTYPFGREQVSYQAGGSQDTPSDGTRSVSGGATSYQSGGVARSHSQSSSGHVGGSGLVTGTGGTGIGSEGGGSGTVFTGSAGRWRVVPSGDRRRIVANRRSRVDLSRGQVNGQTLGQVSSGQTQGQGTRVSSSTGQNGGAVLTGQTSTTYHYGTRPRQTYRQVSSSQQSGGATIQTGSRVQTGQVGSSLSQGQSQHSRIIPNRRQQLSTGQETSGTRVRQQTVYSGPTNQRPGFRATLEQVHPVTGTGSTGSSGTSRVHTGTGTSGSSGSSGTSRVYSQAATGGSSGSSGTSRVYSQAATGGSTGHSGTSRVYTSTGTRGSTGSRVYTNPGVAGSSGSSRTSRVFSHTGTGGSTGSSGTSRVYTNPGGSSGSSGSSRVYTGTGTGGTYSGSRVYRQGSTGTGRTGTGYSTYYSGSGTGGSQQTHQQGYPRYYPTGGGSSRVPGCPNTGIDLRINGMTCQQAIQQHGTYLCYTHEYTSRQCCEVCLPRRQANRRGCEYGDHTLQCRGIVAADCYDLRTRQTCCDSCERLRIQNAPIGCEYGDMTDQCNSVRQNRGLCYIPDNQRLCCNSCNSIRNETNLECPWGDFNSELCQLFGQGSSSVRINCYSHHRRRLCCQSCERLRQWLPADIPRDCQYGDRPVIFNTDQFGRLNCTTLFQYFSATECHNNPSVATNCCYTCHRLLRSRG